MESKFTKLHARFNSSDFEIRHFLNMQLLNEYIFFPCTTGGEGRGCDHCCLHSQKQQSCRL